MRLVVLVLMCVACNVTAQVFLKLGSRPELFEHPTLWKQLLTILTQPWILAGIVCWTVSTLVWIYILSQSELTYAYALYGLNYILTPLAARIVFKESPNAWQAAGLAFIALGVGLTVMGRSLD